MAPTLTPEPVSRFEKFLPGLARLRHYEKGWLRPDVIAGITIAAYAIPQCMAYAEVAGLPAAYGLWGAVGPMLVYAVAGSSRHLSAGPESTTSVMVAALIAPLAGGDPMRYAALAAVAAIFTGILALVGRLARLGFISTLLSRPVLVGYLAGMAILMVAGQLGKIVGVPIKAESTLDRIWEWLHKLGDINWWTVGVSIFVIAVLMTSTRISKHLPGPLIAVVLASIGVVVFSLKSHGVSVVGRIPSGIPGLHLSGLSLGDFRDLVGVAFALVLVAYSDDTLETRAFAARNGYSVNANTELIALGTANIVAGTMGAYPVSSSGSRTAIAEALGIKSQLYSIVCAIVIVLVILFGGGLLGAFPTAALGAIVVWAATKLVDLPEISRLARFRRSEVLLAVATAAGVIVFDVLIGILLAVVLSVVELMRRISRPHDAICGRVPGMPGWHDVDDYPDAQVTPGLVVYRYDGPLCFTNAEFFKTRVLDAVKDGQRHGAVEWLLLNVEAVVELDVTGCDVLAEIHGVLAEQDVTVAFAKVKNDLMLQLRSADLVDVLGANNLYPTMAVAVEAFEHRNDLQIPGEDWDESADEAAESDDNTEQS